MTVRYLLRPDQHSKWYLVPEDRCADWEEWENSTDEDESTWGAPEFAIPVSGPLTEMTFERPKFGKWAGEK